MKTLLLIDANSLIHRSFHALPPLTTPEGTPIQAVYGLASIFLKLWREEKPDYAAALFDRPEPTFRKKKFEAYKAHRPKAPDALISQIIEAHAFFDEFGIKNFEKPGYEADDLIATLAEKFRNEQDLKIVILTGDLDTLQLVEDDKVVVRTFKKGISDTFVYNEQAVMDRYGLKPSQMPDYKALVGDPSDNIKGVPGIGPKTAAQLLQKFSHIEELYENLEEEPKLKEKLSAFRTHAELSKELVLLTRDAPIDITDLRDLVAQNGEHAAPYFKKLGFESLIKRLAGAKEQKEASRRDTPSPRIHALFPQKDEDIIFIYGVGKGLQDEQDFNSGKIKAGVDLKTFLKYAWREGKDLSPPYFDIGVALWLVDPDLKKYDQGSLAKKFLRTEIFGNEGMRELFRASRAKLEEYGLAAIFYDIEMPVLRILAEMEENGMFLNMRKLRELDKKIGERLASLTQEIYKEAGAEFNINSPQQLGKILFEKLSPHNGAKIKKTPGGKLSTDAESLLEIQDKIPIAKLMLEYREGFKIQSTYVKPFLELLDDKGRLRTEFIQTGTATGRLSSREPNLQNIPQESVWAKELRSAFEAPPGFVLAAFDYSQIELRILAALSEDVAMREAFLKSIDIHKATAAKVFDVPLQSVQPEMRRVAKILNFGLIYGMGVAAFAKVSGLTKQRASEFIGAYFREFGSVRLWQEKVKSDARASGYVKTLTGRRRNVLDIVSSSPRIVAEAERAAVNQPVQGLAADIIKLAMIRVKDALTKKGWWNKEVKMVLSIHDELLFEISDSIIKEATPLIKDAMERAYALGVPLKAEVATGKNWGDLQKTGV